jgi:hypothetical protein
MKITRITEEEVKRQAFQSQEEVTGSSPRSFAAVGGGYKRVFGCDVTRELLVASERRVRTSRA